MTGSPRTRRKNTRPSPGRDYYPVFLDLTGKECVVVGGGTVAERKCLSIIWTGARVTVISPRITKRLEGLAREGRLKHRKRLYRNGDLRSAFMVIAATDSEKTNKKVAAEASRCRVLINVVDTPALCTFIVPSVVRRGPLTVAVSTGGASPATAKTIRKELEALYGPSFSRYLTFVAKLRGRVMKTVQDRKRREAMLKSIASRKNIDVLRQKGFAEARKAALAPWQELQG